MKQRSDRFLVVAEAGFAGATSDQPGIISKKSASLVESPDIVFTLGEDNKHF